MASSLDKMRREYKMSMLGLFTAVKDENEGSVFCGVFYSFDAIIKSLNLEENQVAFKQLAPYPVWHLFYKDGRHSGYCIRRFKVNRFAKLVE